MKNFKIILLTLPLLFIATESKALSIETESTVNQICIQKIQPAVNPEGLCKEFKTPCEVPEDWKAIPSCNLIEKNTEKKRISLQEKMKQRFGRRNLSLRTIKTVKKTSSKINKYSRYARKKTSGLRKTRAYTNPSQIRSTKKLKTSTQKRRNFSQYKKYAGKNKSTPKQTVKKYTRPSIRSNIRKNLNEKLSSNPKWKVAKRNHFRTKSYGKNPYSLHSKYSQKQKTERDRVNKSIDVDKRINSGFRTFRGERKIGSLDGEIK